MQILKTILIIVDIILALAVIILTMLQNKEDQGASSTITGGISNNFLDKNKGRTKEGKMKRMTLIFSIAFGVITVVLNMILPLVK